MNTQRCNNAGGVYCTASAKAPASSAEQSLLVDLHRKLQEVRVRMHDLAEWHRAQAAALPMPPELLQATQSAVDALSEEALKVCDAMSGIEAPTITDLKHKAYALEYLLPEEADAHVALCRSMCSDIRRL